MEYIIASIFAVLIATLIVYKVANNLFDLGLRLKSLLLCALCAMFISLILPKIVVGFAGLPWTIAVLAVFAIVFAYFVAQCDTEPSAAEEELRGIPAETSPAELGNLSGVEPELEPFTQEENQSPAESVTAVLAATVHNEAAMEQPAQPEDLPTETSLPDFEPELEQQLPVDDLTTDIPAEQLPETTAEPAAPEIDAAQITQPEDPPTETSLPDFEPELEQQLPVDDLTTDISAEQLPETTAEPAVPEIDAAQIAQPEGLPTETSLPDFEPELEQQLPVDDLTTDIPAEQLPETTAEPAAPEIDAAQITQPEDLPAKTSLPDFEPELEQQLPVDDLTTDIPAEQLPETTAEPTVPEIDAAQIAQPEDLPAKTSLPDFEPELEQQLPADDLMTDDIPPEQLSTATADADTVTSEAAVEQLAEAEYLPAEIILSNTQEEVLLQEVDYSIMAYKDQIVEGVDSEQLDDLIDFAFINKENQDYDTAFKAFSKALALYPTSEAAPFMVVEIGNILKNKGDYDAAITIFSYGRNLSQTKQDDLMEQEFINTVAYLRIIKNMLLQHHLGNIPFATIPSQIAKQIDDEFREWRSLGNL